MKHLHPIAHTVLLWTLIVSLLFSCTGCLSSTPLNRQSIVQAIGIDYENNEYTLSFQIFSPSESGGSNIGASADNAKQVTSKGKTVSEAMSNSVLVQGKRMFIGQNRVIVIGKSAAEQGLLNAFSYFGGDPAASRNAQILFSQTTASDILCAKGNQGILPAEMLEQIAENAGESGKIPNIKLFEVLKSADEHDKGVLIPVISRISQNAQGKDKTEQIDPISTVQLTQTAAFTNDGVFCGIFDSVESRGALWLLNRMRRTKMTVTVPREYTAALDLYHVKETLSPVFEQDNISFHLMISCRASLVETLLEKTSTPHLSEDITTRAQSIIADECSAAWKHSAELSTDLFQLKRYIQQKDAKRYNALKNNFDKMLSDCNLTTSITVAIERYGKEYPPFTADNHATHTPTLPTVTQPSNRFPADTNPYAQRLLL